MARSLCLYGASGSFKTTQVKFFARYIAESTGKATLLLSCDGGGWTSCDPEVEVGMIRPYRCDSATLPLPILQLISKGYWPSNPLAESPQDLKFKQVNWNEVGGIAVEGWTSISQVIMRWLPASGTNVGGENRRTLGGFTQNVTVDGVSLEMNFLSNTRGDYGFVQNQLYGLVNNFGALPCSMIMHTALESKAEDDDRSTIYGPSIAGKKATAACQAWVGDLLHAQDYQVIRNVKAPDPQTGELKDTQIADMKVRIFYKKHPDPATGIPFPAKPRVTPERVTELEKKFPGGYFEPTTEWGIDRYLKTIDELGTSAAADDSLRKWRERQDAKLGRSAANSK